jgi:hypothetical protein
LQFLTLACLLRVPPISSSLIRSPWYYVVKGVSYKAPLHANFPSLLLRHFSRFQIRFSASCSHALWRNVSFLWWQTKLHTHR